MEPTWEGAKALLPRGTQVTGRVTNCQPFGAFVDLGVGFRGLLELINFAEGRTRRVRIPDVGSLITAWVVDYRERNQQIELTQLPRTPEQWEVMRRFWANQ